MRFDYRWFVVFLLSVWLIAVNLARGGMWVGQVKMLPVSAAVAWILAVVTTLGLFLSVLGHELSHALMGRAEGIEIEEIVLHPFGGLARLRNEPDSPRAEFRIAIAGPAASFLFARHQLCVDASGDAGGLSRSGRRVAASLRRQFVARGLQSVSRLSAGRRPRACARSCGGAQATSKKRRASQEFAAC